MLKRFVVVVSLILLCGVFISPPAYAGYQWKTVGVKPYKGDAGWALQHSGFPHYANELLRKEIANGNGVDGKICGGESLKFVTFGDIGIKYDVSTDWDKTKCYATTEYSVVVGSYSFTFINIWMCGNWTGRVQEVEKEELPPLPEPQEITPVVTPPTAEEDCPDYKYPCNRDEDETKKPGSSTPPDNGDEPTPPDEPGGPGNPGNDKPVGGAGESPPNGEGEGFGDGERGKSDTKGNGKNK